MRSLTAISSSSVSPVKKMKTDKASAPKALSDREIRKKVEEHFSSHPEKIEQKKLEKAKVDSERISTEIPDSEDELKHRKQKLEKQNAQVLPPAEKKEAEIPDAAVTSEKLKDILSTGAFKFSDRERNVLNQIINK